MKLRILFFSLLRDIVGAEQVEFDASSGVKDVAGLLEALYAKWPPLREWDGRIRVAVDLEYVGRDHAVSEGQEIAVMPPVQGG